MIEKAKQIEGFMTEPELDFLAKLALESDVIIEIGSWYGRSTRALAENVQGVVYAIDHWNGSAFEKDTHVSASFMNGDNAFYKFCENNFDLIQLGKIIPLRMSARNALWFLYKKGIKADFIFIDGGHTYTEVKEDIENSLPLLKDFGIIAGHDYCEQWVGVMKAVDEIIPTKIVKANTTIWYK